MRQSMLQAGPPNLCSLSAPPGDCCAG